jgi:hypothetical protein
MVVGAAKAADAPPRANARAAAAAPRLVRSPLFLFFTVPFLKEGR